MCDSDFQNPKLSKYLSEIPKSVPTMLASQFSLEKQINLKGSTSSIICELILKYSQIVATWNKEAFCLLSLFLSFCSLSLVYQGLFTREFSPHLPSYSKSPPYSSQGPSPPFPWSRGAPSIAGYKPLEQLERDLFALELDGRLLPPPLL